MFSISRIVAAAGIAAALIANGARTTRVTVDYPEDGSIFPPDISAPTFLWRDGATTPALWNIEVRFADGAPPVRRTVKGARMRVGPIDPECVGPTNELPKLTPRQAASWTWLPDSAAWTYIKQHSVTAPASVIVSRDAGVRGKVRIQTSRDPVGAPIFYRDVPLMPSELEKGVIKPLSVAALPLVAWRLRSVGDRQGRVVMNGLPVCANCHSFSADGKTMGLDLDGLPRNRGLYALASIAPNMRVAKEQVIQWSTAQGELKGSIRVGFLSQVSPDGRYVATTIDPAQIDRKGTAQASNYYVANFKDYRFLQVFYPTRGILMWYSRESGVLQPLPGADDPYFVQMGAVWSPDGRSVVFARAAAKDPDPPGGKAAQYANDPNELQMRYDLYRVPFHDGRGGTPEPVAGASGDGMSSSFPKVSPDGRWIVFVKARNGLLMRPDSQLYIVPFGGGVARRMRCNTSLMNSWHSFSPNGRWLVFSSKGRSPYTQMYLTHIDENGNDSPAILVENATAANRAVNLPEFVNIPPAGLQQIGGPVFDYYKLFNDAVYLQKRRRYAESIAVWKQVVQLRPEDALAHRNLGGLLLLTGKRQEAGEHLRKANALEGR